MRFIRVASAVLLAALALAAAGGGAAERKAAAEPRPVPSMMQEINDSMAASREAIAALSANLAPNSGPQEILAAQREITRIKQEARLDLFRIQLRYAIAEGRTEAVAELKEVITELTTPQPVAVPARPAPVRVENR